MLTDSVQYGYKLLPFSGDFLRETMRVATAFKTKDISDSLYLEQYLNQSYTAQVVQGQCDTTEYLVCTWLFVMLLI